MQNFVYVWERDLNKCTIFLCAGSSDFSYLILLVATAVTVASCMCVCVCTVIHFSSLLKGANSLNPITKVMRAVHGAAHFAQVCGPRMCSLTWPTLGHHFYLSTQRALMTHPCPTGPQRPSTAGYWTLAITLTLNALQDLAPSTCTVFRSGCTCIHHTVASLYFRSCPAHIREFPPSPLPSVFCVLRGRSLKEIEGQGLRLARI